MATFNYNPNYPYNLQDIITIGSMITAMPRNGHMSPQVCVVVMEKSWTNIYQSTGSIVPIEDNQTEDNQTD